MLFVSFFDGRSKLKICQMTENKDLILEEINFRVVQ